MNPCGNVTEEGFGSYFETMDVESTWKNKVKF